MASPIAAATAGDGVMAVFQAGAASPPFPTTRLLFRVSTAANLRLVYQVLDSRMCVCVMSCFGLMC
jgi:hypothetical protein